MKKAVIIREDDDLLADARISLGSPKDSDDFYIVFRGKPEKVIELMERALDVAKVALPVERYEDKRGHRL